MGNIGEEMRNQMPDGLFRLNIFLSACRTIPAGSFAAAVETYLFCPYFLMRHPVFLLKIKILAIINTSFFRLENTFNIN